MLLGGGEFKHKTRDMAEEAVGGRQTSQVWKYFTLDHATRMVTCTICKSVLKYSKSTTNMHGYLKGHQLADMGDASTARSRQVQSRLSSFTVKFRHSSVEICALREKQSQFQNDCAVPWNSTFDMLERLYEQRIPV